MSIMTAGISFTSMDGGAKLGYMIRNIQNISIRVVGLATSLFALVFGSLVVRARLAFDQWPRLSGNDPWFLINKAPQDLFHPIIPYSSHLWLTYLLAPLALIGVVATLISLFHTKRKILRFEVMGSIATLILLVFDSGRFTLWLLD